MLLMMVLGGYSAGFSIVSGVEIIYFAVKALLWYFRKSIGKENNFLDP